MHSAFVCLEKMSFKNNIVKQNNLIISQTKVTTNLVYPFKKLFKHYNIRITIFDIFNIL